MMTVSRVNDPRGRDHQFLGDPRALRTRGLIATEGRLVVERMLRDARAAVDSLLLNLASPLAVAPPPLNSSGPDDLRVPDLRSQAVARFIIHRDYLALEHRLPLALSSVGVAIELTNVVG
jgi:hypothetical protein